MRTIPLSSANYIFNIALADDDEDDRILFRDAIEEIPIKSKLSSFKNGQELMAYLNLPKVILPDIIFLDLNMPLKNGIQCLKEIRRNPSLSEITIAIYSTSSSEKDIEDTFVHGGNIYLNKPCNFHNLRESIEKILKINWQYHTSNFNKTSFLFRL